MTDLGVCLVCNVNPRVPVSAPGVTLYACCPACAAEVFKEYDRTYAETKQEEPTI